MTGFTRRSQDFAVYGIASDAVEIAIIPELGAKVVSLRSVRTGREWMWHPAGALRLFQNKLGDPFEASTLVGADECFPTVASCSHNGRVLNDQGEVWSIPWSLDEQEWCAGRLRTWVRLPVSPFKLERTISMEGDEIEFAYHLTNLAASTESFLWAFHPLFAIEPGDRIELPPGIRSFRATVVDGLPKAPGEWAWPQPMDGVRLDRIDFGASARICLKMFAEGAERATLVRGAESLSLLVDPAEVPALGLWFTTGGWNGHVHLALEPSSAAADSLQPGLPVTTCVLPPLGRRSWKFFIRVRDGLSLDHPHS